MSKNENKDELRLMPKRNPQEFFRKRIGELNNQSIEMDYHVDKDHSIDYTGFPTEYFTKPMNYSDKIDLVLEKKGISLNELLLELSISKEELYSKKDYVLEKLALFSSYPKAFFEIESFINTAKKEHLKKVIISVTIILLVLFAFVGSFLYFYL